MCMCMCKNLNCAESFVRTGTGKIYINTRFCYFQQAISLGAHKIYDGERLTWLKKREEEELRAYGKLRE